MLMTKYKRAVAPTTRERIKRSSGFVRIYPNLLFKIGVNACKIHPVIQGIKTNAITIYPIKYPSTTGNNRNYLPHTSGY